MMNRRFDPSRRRFLSAASGLLGPLVLGLSPLGLIGEAFAKSSALSPLRSQERFLICHSGLHDPANPNHYVASIPGELRVWSPGWAAPRTLALPFLGHSVMASSADRRLAAAFERWGPHAAWVDIEAMSARHLVKLDHQMFNGHGCFDPDGRNIFMTVQDLSDRRGGIAAYDMRELRNSGWFSTGGFAPHDCKLSPAQDRLVVLNVFSDLPAKKDVHCLLSWLDLKSGRILKSLKVGSQGGKFTHFSMSDDGYIILGGFSSARDGVGLLASVDPEGHVIHFAIPRAERDFFHGEFVNFVTDPGRSEVFASLRSARKKTGSVSLWDYKTGTFKGSVHLGCPQAMLRASCGLVVSDGSDSQYKLLSAHGEKAWGVRNLGESSRCGIHMACVSRDS